MIPQWRIGPLLLPVHGVFVGLGVLAAAVVFVAEARRRGAINDRSLVAVTGALVGGALGMRLSGWAQHLDVGLNPTLLQAWQFGSRSTRSSQHQCAPFWAVQAWLQLGGQRLSVAAERLLPVVS